MSGPPNDSSMARSVFTGGSTGKRMERTPVRNRDMYFSSSFRTTRDRHSDSRSRISSQSSGAVNSSRTEGLRARGLS
ncbi:uncharacterized protein N7515_003161 [Penicillium bovifimosum]|uniref:Uncharacterized protein n=1 Tax=Penicillium bovifimosum TaxID=126998 RepID=A0A9W9L4E0_9EURO|nr:uncharacterized protein N7515_003161 [Penicillium bovifimosum]KAJ5138313.1 hypothetical protein N7515_003161 [Penicillium bovifimosum]